MEVRKTFKYRIYPTKSQETLLEQTLEECRWVWNETLALRKNAWDQERRAVSLYQTNAAIPAWRANRESLGVVYSQVLQQVQVRVDLAFKAFFRRVKAGENPGHPRFKGAGRYDSFTYPQLGFGLSGNKVRLSKIGVVKVKLHRPIEGKIKTCTVCRNNGKWFVFFSCEEVQSCVLPISEKMIGVDLGLISFATLSNGKKIENPRFFRSDQDVLKKAQTRLSKVSKGTPERSKRRRVVARIHERIANKRGDFAHKLSHRLVNAYGIIVFEDLKIQRMLDNGTNGLNKSISDAAWNQLVRCCSYKAENAGRKVILVDPRNTSKMCSRCGELVKKELSDRVHLCPHCKLKIDRDWNAAINILRLGLQSHQRSPRL